MLELERGAFSDPWTEPMIVEELLSPRCYYLAAYESDAFIGYAGLSSVLDEGEIRNIAVKPQFRNRGVGFALLDALQARARELQLAMLTLEVRISNDSAIALYSKFGFEQIGVRRGYYLNPLEDALIMLKQLTQT
jgi:ribosomal-protein-alanine N-acetyltransferase